MPPEPRRRTKENRARVGNSPRGAIGALRRALGRLPDRGASYLCKDPTGKAMQFRSADVLIDTDSRQLFRGGDEIALSPKAFQLLAILAFARPRALSKSELHDALWPDTFVVEPNLSNLVGEIRAALTDSPRQPRF